MSSEEISDDDILSLWYTVQPSKKQQEAMTYESSGPFDVTCPTVELRRLFELAIQYANNHSKTEEGKAQ